MKTIAVDCTTDGHFGFKYHLVAGEQGTDGVLHVTGEETVQVDLDDPLERIVRTRYVEHRGRDVVVEARPVYRAVMDAARRLVGEELACRMVFGT